MPTYDYRCEACGHEWDMFQSMSADPEKKCPSCKKRKAHRLIGTGAGLIFKGSGFYETDYRSDSYKKSAAADTKTESSASDSGTKTDTKPAETKSESKSAATKSKNKDD